MEVESMELHIKDEKEKIDAIKILYGTASLTGEGTQVIVRGRPCDRLGLVSSRIGRSRNTPNP